MTTIVSVRRNGVVAVGGDGQVTMGQSTILKGNARKVRKIFHDKVIAGFAGSTADAFTLLDLFEKKLEELKAEQAAASKAQAAEDAAATTDDQSQPSECAEQESEQAQADVQPEDDAVEASEISEVAQEQNEADKQEAAVADETAEEVAGKEEDTNEIEE